MARRNELVAALNLLGLLGITAVQLAAYAFQFAQGELPCPLCLLQRVAFAMVAFGFLLNVTHGSQPAHYGIILLSALFGASVSGRQILLHIVPGSGAYGSAILDLHFYTWAFLLFVATILATATLLLLHVGECQPDAEHAPRPVAVHCGDRGHRRDRRKRRDDLHRMRARSSVPTTRSAIGC